MYALQKATVGKFYSWNVFFLFCRFVQNLHAIVIKRGLLHRMSSVHLLLSLAEQIGCFFFRIACNNMEFYIHFNYPGYFHCLEPLS